MVKFPFAFCENINCRTCIVAYNNYVKNDPPLFWWLSGEWRK